MSIPSSVTQILATLVLVVPGFVYQGVRIRLRGRTPSDNEIGPRILQAIVVSTVFALLYILVLGTFLTNPNQLPGHAAHHPRPYALLGLLLAFVVPAASAWIASLITDAQWWKYVLEGLPSDRWKRIDTRPTAWDVAFSDITPCFIRVRTKDKTWYAGWFSTQSYASSWPDPPTLYLEFAYEIDEFGTIGAPVIESRGAVIDCTEVEYIEFLNERSTAS